MNNYSKTLLAVAFVALFALAPAANAQSSTLGFGTQVKLGDVDFVPTANAIAAVAYAAGTQVKQIDFGITGQVTDNCFYLDRGAVDGTAILLTAVRNFDIRLTPCQGKAAGTLVGDSDTVEKSTASAGAGDANVNYADVNNNGRYDMGDYVYLTTGGATALTSSTGLAAWTIRLTAAGSKAAGTLLFAGDADQTAYGAAVVNLAAATFPYFDADNTATLTSGDAVYASPAAVALNALFPQYSVRLVGGSGAFGTQVKLGDADFVPTANAIAAVAYAAGTQVKQIDFGITGQVTDNCFYLDRGAVDGTAILLTAVRNFDIRLTPCQGKAAGTLVGDSDTVEKSTASAGAGDANVNYADVNNNGRYDMGDYVYLTTGGATALTSSTGLAAWTLRLSAAGSKAAGTLLFAGDADQTAYGAAVVNLAAATFPYFDADNTATLTTGDAAYVSPVAVALNGLIRQYSVRLVGGSGAFGTQAKLGDADFVATANAIASVAYAAGTQIKQIDFGITGQVTDNCFYLDRGAVDGTAILLTAVRNFDIRLTPCQGKAAGTLVGDSDTVEKSTASAGAGDANVNYADVNNNGRYDMGDYVYVTTGGATTLTSSTGLAAWTLRLSAAGSKAAGTLLFAGDADQTAYGAAVVNLAAAAFVYFDADNTATLTSGDVAYLSPAAVALNGLVPQYSIRLAGTPTASGPNPGGNPNTSTSGSASSSSSASSSTSASGSASSSSSHSSSSGNQQSNSSSSSKSSKTPGFELVALVAALGAALVLVRRKL